MHKSNFSRVDISVLNERFPNFSFVEDEYFYDLTILTKELIEVIMSDNVTEFVIDANQEYRPVNLGIHNIVDD